MLRSLRYEPQLRVLFHSEMHHITGDKDTRCCFTSAASVSGLSPTEATASRLAQFPFRSHSMNKTGNIIIKWRKGHHRVC